MSGIEARMLRESHVRRKEAKEPKGSESQDYKRIVKTREVREAEGN